MVGCHGALCEGFSGKDSQSDVVGWTVGDEVRRHVLGHLEAVGAHILGEHTHRDVHSQHHVDAFHDAVHGACQHYHHHRVGQAAQYHGQVYQPHAPALCRILVGIGVAHAHCRLLLPLVEEIPQYVWYEQKEQQQIFFISKFHVSKLIL